MIQTIERPMTTIKGEFVEGRTVAFIENGQQVATRVGQFLFINEDNRLINLRTEQELAEKMGQSFPANDSELEDRLGIYDIVAAPVESIEKQFVNCYTTGEPMTFETLLVESGVCKSRQEVRRLCALNAFQILTKNGAKIWKDPKAVSRLYTAKTIWVYDREYLISPVEC